MTTTDLSAAMRAMIDEVRTLTAQRDSLAAEVAHQQRTINAQRATIAAMQIDTTGKTMSVACPHCIAPASTPCVSTSGVILKQTHSARMKALVRSRR